MRARLLIMSLTLICAVPRPGAAQRMVPDDPTLAVGGDTGFAAARSDEGTIAFTADAFVEYYVVPRASLRGLYGWARTDLQTETATALRRRHLLLNVVDNRDLGALSPFATAGGGVFFLQPQQGGQPVGAPTTKPGGALGWGVDYFLSEVALRTEMTALMAGQEEPDLGAKALPAFTWTLGVKVPF